MSVCHRCGAEISWVRAEGVTEKIALDRNPQIRGERRFRLKEIDTLLYEPVDPRADVSAYPAHEETCPALQRERERY